MPSFIVIHYAGLSWYSLFKRNGESVDLGEREGMGSTGKSGGRGNYSWLCMREKEKKKITEARALFRHCNRVPSMFFSNSPG